MEKEIDYQNADENKLLLYNKFRDIAEKVTHENKDEITEHLVERLHNEASMEALNDLQKRNIVETFLTIALNIINTQAIQQEKRILEKRNVLNKELFLSKYTEKLNELNLRIEANKKDFLELKKDSKNLSMNELANKINEFHDPNTKFEVSEDELDNFLNGGTLEF